MNFLHDIYRLSYIKRYSNIPKIHEESVAEHGFFVSVIVIKLHELYDFDLGKALLIAVSHDIPEMELNDCPHIIKKKYPKIAEAYEVCEAEVRSKLPKEIAWGAEEFDKQSTVEAMIVHLADVIQCIQFSSTEIRMGNDGYMSSVYSNSTRRKQDLEALLGKYQRNS